MPPPTGHWWSIHGPGARCFLLLPVLASTLRGVAVAAPLDGGNSTIDNANGDNDEFHHAPVYSTNISSDLAQDSTIARWVDQTCTGCLNRPDPGRVFNGTYTELYLPPGNSFTYNAAFSFNGSAVYVYLVLSNQANTDCIFILDKTPVRHFVGGTTDPFQYNTLALAQTGLETTMHELIIQAEGKPDAGNYLNFDFAQYTPPSTRSLTSDPDTPIPTPTPTRPVNNHITAKSIAGGVVGGFIAVVALILATAFYRRRHRRPPKDDTGHIHPFPGTSPNPTMSDEERHRLMSLSLSSSLQQQQQHHHQHHHHIHESHSGQPSSSYDYDANHREYVRQQRQRELNERLETVKREMRDMKATFMLEQQVARAQGQQGPGSPGDYDDQPPAFRIVPGGMGRHPHESALADMREQMRIMMDQIQYLRAQQNSSYVQGLTDEPPPGYLQTATPSRYQS